MSYWLIKSEPSTYSWHNMQQDGTTGWTGVRNHQAANYLRSMRLGDMCFFYHSNVGLAIVGIVRVVRTAYQDNTDRTGKFVMVDVAAEKSLLKPVSLQQIKQNPKLAHLPLIRQSRLSVMPIDTDSWEMICSMGGLY